MDLTEELMNAKMFLFVAGYFCYAIFKKKKCNSCKNLIFGNYNEDTISEINSYFQEINRASMLYPNDTITNAIIYNYKIVGKLTKKFFFHSTN